MHVCSAVDTRDLNRCQVSVSNEVRQRTIPAWAIEEMERMMARVATTDSVNRCLWIIVG